LITAKGNSAYKLCHTRSVAYLAELNKHQIMGGRAYLLCYPVKEQVNYGKQH